MKYIFNAIVYCEVSMVSTNPIAIHDYFKKIEEEADANYHREGYVANNDDYYISVIEMDKPRAKELSFESSSEFREFMKGFHINEIEFQNLFDETKMVAKLGTS